MAVLSIYWGLLITFGVLGFLFLLIIVEGILLYGKIYTARPSILGVFFNREGKAEHKNIKCDMFDENKRWKKESFDKTKVAFDAYPNGFGKAIPLEWDADDYIEWMVADGRKIVLFGLKHINFKVWLQLSTMKNALNVALADGAIWQQEAENLKVELKKEVNDTLDLTKKLAPVYVKPSTKK